MARKMPSDMVAGTVYESKNYGDFKIIKYNSYSDIEVEFLSTGFKTSARSSHIRNGMVKDKLIPIVCGIGFIGDGKFSTKDKNAYKCWGNMLERCYDEKFQAKNPTYKGCTVCDEWHNFQNFAKWYEENYPKNGGIYQLDKDLSCYGERGKLYSPETCIFVTAQTNTEEACAKSYRFKSPEGNVVDVYNLRKFCRENNLNQGHMCQVANGKIKSSKGWKAAP